MSNTTAVSLSNLYTLELKCWPRKIWEGSKSINVFSQSIMRTWMPHKDTTGTEKSLKWGHCVWVTQRNRVLRVSKSPAVSVALLKGFCTLIELVPNISLHITAPSPPNYRKRPNNEKATDDYHYEKFKKMNRRYWGAVLVFQSDFKTLFVKIVIKKTLFGHCEHYISYLMC